MGAQRDSATEAARTGWVLNVRTNADVCYFSRFENFKFLQPHQQQEMRRVREVHKEAALEEDRNLTVMRPLDEGPVVFPRTMG